MTDASAGQRKGDGGDAGKDKPDLRNLQDKFHGLLDQRNEYNDLARGARQDRDLLNDQRREKSAEIEELKQKRDALNEKMREHKEQRNAYQDQAKALIGQKKGMAGALERSLPLQVRKLRNDLQEGIQTQQTSSLTPQKERVLVEKIRDMWLELKEKEAELEKQKHVEVDLSDTDEAIDALFARADDQHAKVMEYQKQAQDAHERFVAGIKEIRVLVGESNAKHKEFIAYKNKADEFHNKAMELREKVMAVRQERREAFESRKKELRDLNENVRRNVLDEKAIEKAKERSLEDLKKGGKISLGGW